MRFFSVVLLNLVLLSFARAGGDVPWPIKSQEAIRVADLTGTWMSMNVKDPGYMYFFSFSANSAKSSKCPYQLIVEAMNPYDHVVVSKGRSSVCLVTPASITFNLYDASGHLRNQLRVVGLRKSQSHDTTMGEQFLGVRIYDGAPRPQLVTADTFYKYSEEPAPVWPENAVK